MIFFKETLVFLIAALPAVAGTATYCCSWNFATCGDTSDWCNESETNCEGSCGGQWIDPSTPPPCTAIWSACHNTQQACCGGATCVYVNDYYSQCKPAPEPSPTPPPVQPTHAPHNNHSPTPPPVNPTPAPAVNPTPVPAVSPTFPPAATAPPGSVVGELTWWTGSTPGPLEGSSCGYAQPAHTVNGASWLEPYVYKGMYCAVSEDLFANGVGCGSCYRLVYDGVGGTDPATPGSADIQVVNSGAGGVDHFDCFEDAFNALTGISTGIFPVYFVQIPCEATPVTVTVIDGNNAYYVKVLVAGGTTGVATIDIMVGGQNYVMSKVVGATWAAGLAGLTNVSIQFDVTFDDGTTVTVSNCFGGGNGNPSWPVATGIQCAVV